MDGPRAEDYPRTPISRRRLLKTLAALAASGVASLALDSARIALAAPALSLNPEERKYGYSVTATFSGYQANEQITLLWNSNRTRPKNLLTTTADGSGNAVAAFRVPSDVRGWHQLKGAGALGSSAIAELRVLPRMRLSRTSGPRGTTLTVSIYGFTAYEYAQVRWDPARRYTVIGDGNTSSLGSAKITVTIPSNARIGRRNIVVAGSSGSGDYTTFTVTE
jgi:hypothetical protein